MKGHQINVVTFQHMPSTLRKKTTHYEDEFEYEEITYSGLEIEVIDTTYSL